MVQHTPTVLAAVVFFGCFMRIRQRWFIPGYPAAGYTTWVATTTVDGTAIAPNQYRVLMPWVDDVLAVLLRVPLPTAILVSDLVLLGVTFVLLVRISARLGTPSLVVGAAAVWAWWVAKLDHWHPEIMALTVIVTATALLLLDRRPRCSVLLVLGLVACLARTDYAATLGVVIFAVGLHRRRLVLASTGVAVAGAAVIATVLLVRAFPQAHYVAAVVQLAYNLSLGSWGTVLSFYGVVVALPLLLAARRRALPPLAFVLAMFAVEFAAVFVVGRVDESRIFMPLAPMLGAAAVLAWRELQRSSNGQSGSPT